MLLRFESYRNELFNDIAKILKLQKSLENFLISIHFFVTSKTTFDFILFHCLSFFFVAIATISRSNCRLKMLVIFLIFFQLDIILPENWQKWQYVLLRHVPIFCYLLIADGTTSGCRYYNPVWQAVNLNCLYYCL